MNDIVPTRELAKDGVAAIGGIAGGIGLLILGSLPSIFGIVAGGVVGLIGLGAMGSSDPSDKRAGLVALLAGGLTVLSKVGIFAGLANGFLGLATVGLLGMGIWKAIKFYKGLKSRA
ncbi:hypothetical protein [Treponema sp. J25]|uniref:hypothetical protein n=1 Tax=Treponema sp. J25 TaxID=2094121 RepID=UPI0010452863|nr:hypothetical protein [Treponema sp. J25]TCW62552.1 hypothetical protein C5O22_00400 [Treponema sp. J25]HOM23587.1 hypothetical protein [Termitinemataceae bacterium]